MERRCETGRVRTAILLHGVALLSVLGAVLAPDATPAPVPGAAARAAADAVPRSRAPDVLPGTAGRNPGSVRSEGRRIVRVIQVGSGHSGGRLLNQVDKGLDWLKSDQATDGGWTAGPNARTEPAVTGLVMLSFLGAGETHRHGQFKKTVKDGLRSLKHIQGSSGCFGDPADSDHSANHAIATLAMCEAYGQTASPLFKQSAQQALDFISRMRRPHHAVAIWEILALRSGARAGLEVPEGTKRGDLAWLDRVTDSSTGVASFASFGVIPDTTAGQTAAALLCRILCGEDVAKSEVIGGAVKFLLESKPGTRSARGDEGLVYFGTLAMFQVGGEPWKEWNRALKEREFGTAVKEGENAGSWDPAGRNGDLLGRPGTTALRIMNQQVYYRYVRVFGVRR
jgi:hypothetical protein